MKPRPGIAVALVMLIALAGAGAGLAAAKPSPQELWEVYPLDPAGAGTRERPAPTTTGAGARERPPTTTAAAKPSPAPRSGVAGASTTRRKAPDSATATGAAPPDASVNGRTPLSFGVLLGALAASILLLALAALPMTAAPRRAGLLIERRIELAVVGTLTLLVITVVYLSSVA